VGKDRRLLYARESKEKICQKLARAFTSQPFGLANGSEAIASMSTNDFQDLVDATAISAQLPRRSGYRPQIDAASIRKQLRTIGPIAILCVAACVLYLLGSRLAPRLQLALWVVLLILSALALRGVWRNMFGPVLFYDVIRTARRGRYMLLRFCYAA